MSTTHAEPSGKPGKYQRSTSGLVVAIVVTVVTVVGLIWVMGWFRSEPEYDAEPIDLPEVIGQAQAGGLDPVYPRELPDGFVATAAEVPTNGDGFEIRLLHGDDAFIGIRTSAEASAGELLGLYVDDDAANITDAGAYRAAADSIAPEWESWTDAGGDTAYAAELGSGRRTETVLVYGSADAEDLQAVVDALTREPV